jgi:hypothetical protein
VVLPGIPEEGRGAGKQGMVLPYGQGHFAYVWAYRKCIDEIEQLKKELWNIIMGSKVDMNNRIQATKELHSLSKTSVLLIKDLPFVTNLSKFYDNSSYNNIIQSKNAYSNSNSHEVARIAYKEQNLTAKI